jgi:hypothetical protein
MRSLWIEPENANVEVGHLFEGLEDLGGCDQIQAMRALGLHANAPVRLPAQVRLRAAAGFALAEILRHISLRNAQRRPESRVRDYVRAHRVLCVLVRFQADVLALLSPTAKFEYAPEPASPMGPENRVLNLGLTIRAEQTAAPVADALHNFETILRKAGMEKNISKDEAAKVARAKRSVLTTCVAQVFPRDSAHVWIAKTPWYRPGMLMEHGASKIAGGHRSKLIRVEETEPDPADDHGLRLHLYNGRLGQVPLNF